MYGNAEWRQARRLYGAGISKSAIAHRLGMSRTTVARLLSLPAPPQRKTDTDTGGQRKGTRPGPQGWAAAGHRPAADHQTGVSGTV